jgi:hypothetical protein
MSKNIILVLCILVFTFFDNRWEDIRFRTKMEQAFSACVGSDVLTAVVMI